MPHFSWHLFAVLFAAVVYATAAFYSVDTVRIDVVVQDE
jgi:hypothetical protein